MGHRRESAEEGRSPSYSFRKVGAYSLTKGQMRRGINARRSRCWWRSMDDHDRMHDITPLTDASSSSSIMEEEAPRVRQRHKRQRFRQRHRAAKQ